MLNARSARWWWLLLLLLLLLGSVAAADDLSDDQRFLAGLRQRGLYQLAEAYCAGQLNRPDLPQAGRADLVVEWSRCLAERAAASPPEVREPLWQQALQHTEQFAQRSPQDPRLLLVQLQGALTHLARGELVRQEAELIVDRADRLDEARGQLRLAVDQLRELADATDRRLRQGPSSDRGEPAALSADQFISLKNNIEYQLARALRNQGQAYATDSPDRANSLNQAAALLADLARLDSSDPLAWKSRIDLVVCHRLLADYATARRGVDALLGQKPPAPVELRARAEQIHLALAANQLADAMGLLSQGRQIDGVASAELDYAWLTTYLLAAADAQQPAQAAGWQAKATDMLETIEQLHGPYWARRAGMLLSRYVQASPTGGDREMLVRAAESSFRSGQLDNALKAYDAARTLAAQQGDGGRAFDLGFVAATIEHGRDRHEQALARYRQTALAKPDHGKAAEAHLLAIHHAGQIAKQQTEGSLADYEAMLQEHLRHWKDGPTADQIRMRLGRLRQHRRNWRKAIDAYRAISPKAAEHLQAVEAVESCYRTWLTARKAAGQPTAQLAVEAADWFELQVVGPHGQLPEQWSPAQRVAALAAARMRMDAEPADYARAEAILTAALGAAPDAPAPWQSAARALLAGALAGQGRVREAGGLLAEIPAASPGASPGASSGPLLDMLEGLARVAESAPPETRAKLARLQQQAIERLDPQRSRLSPAQRRILETARAQAQSALDEEQAKSLLAQDDRRSVQEALKRWRELEKKSQPGSPPWFRAKYSVALSHYRLGNTQQAAKIIELLQLLHPGSGGPEMKARFDDLLRRCRE